MKSNGKSRLIVIGILFVLLSIITNKSFIVGISEKSTNFSDDINLETKSLELSAVSGTIHIKGNTGWNDFKNAGNCTGSGTYSEPYVIKDLVIDGMSTENAIWIENSNVYFVIENCTLQNAIIGYPESISEYQMTQSVMMSPGHYPTEWRAGIRLSNVENSLIITNDFTSNWYGIFLTGSDNNTIMGNSANNNYFGIRLTDSNDNTILGNAANNNGRDGIYLDNSDNNIISENTANNNNWKVGINLLSSNNNIVSGNTVDNNGEFGISLISSNNSIVSGNNASNTIFGIYLGNGYNNNISDNVMNDCGLGISGSREIININDIDTTNLVNGKLLYYYTNEVNLGQNDFTNAGQVILVDCNNSVISNLNISYTSIGILLLYSNNNTISGNNVNDNKANGIYLGSSNNNIIMRNNASNDDVGIHLDESNNNTISGNSASGNSFGIYLGHYLSGCNNNTITENLANYNTLDGIIIWDSKNIIITRNTVNDNKYGIRFFDSNYNTISRNIIKNNFNGIFFINSSNNMILENTVSSNINTGIKVSGSNNIFSGNIAKNNYRGIYLYNLYEVQTGLPYIGPPNNNTLYLNKFINNNEHLFSDDLPTILNSPGKIIYTYQGDNYTNYLGNYWDNYRGSDVNNDGIGDTPYTINEDVDNYPLMEPIENYEIIGMFEPSEVIGGLVPGYNLFILLGILSIAVILINISKKLKKP